MHVANYIARNEAVMLESENKCKSFDPIHLRYKQGDNIVRNNHQALQLVHVFCKVTLIEMNGSNASFVYTKSCLWATSSSVT